MARQEPGLLVVGAAMVAVGALFFVSAVAGLLFATASSPTDLGVQAVTLVLLGFGVGALLLRKAKIKEASSGPADRYSS